MSWCTQTRLQSHTDTASVPQSSFPPTRCSTSGRDDPPCAVGTVQQASKSALPRPPARPPARPTCFFCCRPSATAGIEECNHIKMQPHCTAAFPPPRPARPACFLCRVFQYKSGGSKSGQGKSCGRREKKEGGCNATCNFLERQKLKEVCSEKFPRIFFLKSDLQGGGKGRGLADEGSRQDVHRPATATATQADEVKIKSDAEGDLSQCQNNRQ